MAEELTLEKEFTVRTFMHKTTLLGAYLMDKYIKREIGDSPVNLPMHVIKEHAWEYSNREIQKYMQEGSFDDHYEVAWSVIAPTMSDTYNILQWLTLKLMQQYVIIIV